MQHSHFTRDVIEGPAKRFHEVKQIRIQLGKINSAKRQNTLVETSATINADRKALMPCED
jgi:hypothetical protein